MFPSRIDRCIGDLGPCGGQSIREGLPSHRRGGGACAEARRGEPPGPQQSSSPGGGPSARMKRPSAEQMLG